MYFQDQEFSFSTVNQFKLVEIQEI